MIRRDPATVRSDYSLRAKARALSAERPAVESTPEQRARAFDGLEDAPIATSVPTPASEPAKRPTIQEIRSQVTEQLHRAGVPGGFTLTDGKVTVRAEWFGAACHRGDAERALKSALADAGYLAGSLPGYGVSINKPAESPPAPVPAAPVSQVRRTPDRIESLSGLEEPLGDEPSSEELRAYEIGKLPSFGYPSSPAWTKKPAAQFAHARGREALRTVEPSEMDPEERSRSLLGRMLTPAPVKGV